MLGLRVVQDIEADESENTGNASPDSVGTGNISRHSTTLGIYVRSYRIVVNSDNGDRIRIPLVGISRRMNHAIVDGESVARREGKYAVPSAVEAICLGLEVIRLIHGYVAENGVAGDGD